MRTLNALLALYLSLAASAALGFGAGGHAASGRLADRLIEGTAAKAQVPAILLPGERLEEAANWADCVRGIKRELDFDYAPDYQEPACRFYEDALGGKQEMSAYARNNDRNCLYAGKEEECHKAFHFTNVPVQAGRYAPESVGAGNADIVHAINATVRFLRDGTVSEPFRFSGGEAGRREALRLLAHLAGDIHQPMHVGSVYLTRKGRATNPNKGGYDPDTHTVGGNSLLLAPKKNLHSKWDSVGLPLLLEDLTGEAAVVIESQGAPDTWAAQWASETILQARVAFRGLSFGHKTDLAPPARNTWPVKVKNLDAYDRDLAQMQRVQVIRAGARLAEILQAVWPH